MKRSRCAFFIVCAILTCQLSAAPKIEFTTKIFEGATAVEGVNEIIHAVFKVNNTGDAVLKLQNIRPGCGCTAITYVDSLIAPGKSGRIEASMNTKGFRSGPLSKSILVASNAVNEPTLQLRIKTLVQAYLDVSEKYLTFNAAFGNKDTVFLASKKSDLKITGIDFRATDKADDKPDWQTDIPFPIGFKALPKDSTRADGYKVWSYELTAPKVPQSLGGQITIKTNHPDKTSIILPASLLL